MASTLFVHHSADYDGLFSAAVGKKFLPEDTVFVGWDYGQPLVQGWQAYDSVYVVDLNPGCLEGFDASPHNRERVVYIDHHKSAIEKYSDMGPIDGYRWDGVAACRLLWQWFVWRGEDGQKPDAFLLPRVEEYRDRRVLEPLALTLAGEYDVFDLHDPRALSFLFGLQAHGYETVDKCLELLDDHDEVEIIAQDGVHGQKWMEKFAADCCLNRGYLVEFEGCRYWCLVSVHARGSIWFPNEAVPGDCEGLMSVRLMGDKQAAVSLYHRPGREDIDHSVAAVKWGGGGHRGACGFTLTLTQAMALGVLQ